MTLSVRLGFLVVAATALGQPQYEDKLLLDAYSLLHTRATIERLEKPALDSARGVALRSKGDLTLRFSSGSTRVYKNSPACTGVECEEFALLGYLPTRGMFVIWKAFYEGSRFLIVDAKDGRETEVGGTPIFSASGRRVAVCISDAIELGFEFQVWERGESRFLQKWSGTPPISEVNNADYRCIGWLNESEASVEILTQGVPSGPYTPHRFTLALQRGKWAVLPGVNAR